jgi:predicted TIM-barrel fold metal-dependent hydrolase
MVIDGDTHISPVGEGFSVQEQLQAMQRSGVDRAVVWLSPHHYVGEEIADHNRYIYESARAHPGRLLPFGWTDPSLGVESAKKMVRLCTEVYGFHGVKMNGAQNNYFIDDPELGLPVAEEIAKTGRMLALHIGPDAYERTHPWRAMHIAKRFPETKILMVHMGMADEDMNRAVIEIAAACPNMVLIASGTTDRAALEAIRTLGAARVCFGSDHPFRKMHVARAMFEASLEEELSAEEMQAFMGGNLGRLFGLEE